MNKITVNIPEGTNGNFRITKSKYNKTNLMYKDISIMSDSPEEYEEHNPFFSLNLKGNVLVCGLGIGFINETLISVSEIEKIVIVEKYQEVIDLVWPYCKKDERFEIIKADANTWKPTMHFDYAWLDSWIEHDEIKQDDWWKLMTEKYSPDCDTIMFWKPKYMMT